MHWFSITPEGEGTIYKLTSTPKVHYLANHPYGGNFKLSRSATTEDVSKRMTQFELSFGSSNLIYYDISNKDSDIETKPPFMAHGMKVSVSGGIGADAHGLDRCQPIYCPSGRDPCLAVYLPDSPLP